MTPIRNLYVVVCLLCAATLAGCTQTAPVDEWDGLVRRPGTGVGTVFVKPDVVIGDFTSVMLDPVQVSFASNWDPNRGVRNPAARLNASDVTAIQTGLATMFRESFSADLTRSNFQLVEQAGPQTLRVSAAIVNLFVTAPDTMTAGRSRTFTANSGQMTLVVELRDSVTGELLARAVDTQRGRQAGSMSFTNNVTNTADARRAINTWSSALIQGLNDLYNRTN